MLIEKRAPYTGPMDYTAVCRTGAQTLTYSTRSGMEMFGKNPVFFPAEKSVIFLCRKIAYFSVWKNRIFLYGLCPVLDSGQLGTLDSGQRDAGQWTDGLSSMGQWDTGRAVLYWTDAARGRWTVDAGQVDSGRDRVDRTFCPALYYSVQLLLFRSGQTE